MRQNPNYLLTHLAGIPYLLPFGQLLADHKRSVHLNDSGETVWNQLKQPQSRESLFDALKKVYDVRPEETDLFRRDLDDFLSSMLACGVLLDSDHSSHAAISPDLDSGHSSHAAILPDLNSNHSSHAAISPDSAADHAVFSKNPAADYTTPDTSQHMIHHYIQIAGLNIDLYVPSEAYPSEFDLFAHPEMTGTDQAVTTTAVAPEVPSGRCLIFHPQLCVYDCEDYFQLYFPSSLPVPAATLRKDGTGASFHVQPPYTEELRSDLFQGIRTVFLYLAAQKDMYAIHSASICYQQKAWLFSGPSGTGKSTHTNLWKKYLGTPVINGDLNLLAIEDGSAVIHGIPWCGTSGICDSRIYALGGITLLKQDSSNHLIDMTDDQKQLFVLQRIISPCWDSGHLQKMVRFVALLTGKTSVFRLGCTVSEEAVYTIQAAIRQLCHFLTAVVLLCCIR